MVQYNAIVMRFIFSKIQQAPHNLILTSCGIHLHMKYSNYLLSNGFENYSFKTHITQYPMNLVNKTQ